MNREDTARTLLNSVSVIMNRDWGSSEKNNRSAKLARSIREAVNRRDDAEMERLAAEVKYFMLPTFTLFERMRRLAEKHG